MIQALINVLLNFDNQLFFLINQHGHNVLSDRLAGLLVDWPLFLIIFLFIYSERHRRTSWLLLITMAVSIVLNSIILKNIFRRARPYWIFPEALHVPRNSFLWSESFRPPLASFAFPSGHTALAGAVAYVAFLRHSRLRLAVVLLTFLTCLARVFVGVHRPLDVLAGVGVGVGVGVVTPYLMPYLLRFLPERIRFFLGVRTGVR